ncbi:MAG: ABC transporter permease subunit [Polyangiaceae bacterium]|nr:ABC transporter permease subunit [Polyangiaceae bacterium]
MAERTLVVALNTFREAVRARILLGLFAAAIATGGYSLIVGAFALHNTLRVVSDLGALFISLFSVVTAVVLASTSLYRELELKTLFPILTRPIRRTEYLAGKFLGTVLTLFVFISANVGCLLFAMAGMAGYSTKLVVLIGFGVSFAFVIAGVFGVRLRSYLPIPWALLMLGIGWALASGAPDDRRVLVGLGFLTLCEVCIVTAIATVFSSFSSPFLTTVFTFGVFLVGRSADTLAKLPPNVFGETIHNIGEALSKVVPNLMIYVPNRPLLTGQLPDVPLAGYLATSALHAALWSVVLLALASIVFRRRDFP